MLCFRPGGEDPDELQNEFGESLDFLCARLKLAQVEKQVEFMYM